MALKVSLLLAFFLLTTATLSRQQQHQQQQNQCDLRNIQALEHYNTLQAEAGVTKFWDSNDQQFQCAGVEFIRHRIQPGGLLLPSYVNAPLLPFVEQGEGVQGVVLPGCPETFEYSSKQQFSQRDERGEHGGQSFQDRHQSVQNLRKGDVLAIR